MTENLLRRSRLIGIFIVVVGICIAAIFLDLRNADDSSAGNGDAVTAPESSTNSPSARDDLDLESKPESAATYTFQGHVTDGRNNPMPYVSVGLVHDETQSFLTDEEGRFYFENVAPGQYEVQLLKTDWGEFSESLMIDGDVEKDFIFLNGLHFRGRVTESGAGTAVERYDLSIHTTENEVITGDDWKRLTIADPDGRFEFEPPNDARMEYVRIDGYGYETQKIPFTDFRTDEENLIELQPLSNTRIGTVLTPEGHPQPSASIFDRDMGGNPQTISDENGQFRFKFDDDNPDASVVLWAKHDAYAPGLFRGYASDVSVAPVEIRLTNAGALRVHITSDGTDRPGQKVSIGYLPSLAFDDMLEISQITSDEGIADFEGLSPGEYRISIERFKHPSGPDGSLKTQNVTYNADTQITSGNTTHHEIAFDDDSSHLEGYVTRNGEPIGGTNVYLNLQGSYGDLTLKSKCGADGYYLFDHLPAGRAVVKLWFEGDDDDSVRLQTYATEFQTYVTELRAGMTTRLDLVQSRGTATLSILVSSDWTNSFGLVLVYEGHKTITEASLLDVVGLFNEDFVSTDLSYIALNDLFGTPGDIRTTAGNLDPGNYTVLSVNCNDDSFFLSRGRYIVEHITLTDGEHQVIEHML